jgi:two-component system phosphate regulon response regulator OmpR
MALEVLKKAVFDVMVLDVMMPGITGIELTRELRKRADLPILMLTALAETGDKIKGLEAGVDDYLSKPFEPKELLLRLKAILRRKPEPVETAAGFEVGRWQYDPAVKELFDSNADERIRLTEGEAGLLEVLARHAGRILRREELARLCGLEGNDRTIDVQVTRLRRKIEDDSRAPRYLQTIRGEGYMLRTGGI